MWRNNMIVKEFYMTRTDGVNLYRNYSDQGFYILQVGTGIQYEEAIDVEGAPYTYTETNIPVDVEPTGEATEEDLYNALAELGVSDND